MAMKHNIIHVSIVAMLAVGAVSCSQEEFDPTATPTATEKKIMAFTFSHPSQTRATESAFEKGDKVGLYVAESGKPLEIAGNVVNNQLMTFDGTSWSTANKLYWDDGSFEAYAYYPYQAAVNSVTDLMFEVSTDQSTAKTQTALSGYEASDLLFASAKEIVASENPVNLTFRHIMSKISVRLIKGDDYEGEIPENTKVVIHNTVPTATIDLSAGVATKYSRGTRQSIIARKAGSTTYSAIIVPQRLENRVPLIEVIANGVSFMYDSKFLFKPGIHHIVNLVLDKNPEQIKIEIGGEIENWN